MPTKQSTEKIVSSEPKKGISKERASLLVSYAQAYESLNEGQKKAVDSIEGPVMCIAGPGTGKTQVVALRIAKILERTHMRPSNILCLTFSTNAATEMRERLRKYVGSDAYGVTVRNFHSFCNELILDHPHVFDQWSALEQISDVERYRSLNKIIDQLGPDLALINQKNPHGRTGEIIGRISQLKREGKTDKEELLAIANEYEEMMSTKSREGTKAHAENLLRAQKFKEFLQIFFAYQDMLEQTQRYDYEDMILRVNQALKENEWLLAGLQERYQYVLVDEFQDTNGAQYNLIELLTTYPAMDHAPNLFVVGDDDQSIYRFQGANLQNILSFHRRFPKAVIATLSTSYRCPQSVLDAAGSLIAHNTERLVGTVDGIEKNLKSPKKEDSPKPTLLFSPSDMTEPWLIADLIEDRLEKGVSPSEIAILVQKNSELQPLYEVLTARSIPVHMGGKVDLLASPLVRQTIAILKAVTNPHLDSALAAALACECFECHPADLGKIFSEKRENKESVFAYILGLNQNSEHYVNLENILHARDTILDLHQKLPSRTVVDSLQHLLKESHLLAEVEKDNLSSTDPLEYAALQEFFDRLKYRAYEQPSFTFESFLSDLQFFEDPDYRELRMSYSLPHLTEEGVELMTAHQSKGLEFEVVILANFRDGHWDKRRRPSSLSVPEDMLFGWEKDQKAFEQNQDERRICYVAMTRAKKELLFTCPKQLTSGDKLRDVSPSGFFAEAGVLPEQECDLKDPHQASTLLLTPPRNLDTEMQAFLKQRLENFALSVTALNHFLEDPQLFLEIDLLQMPQAKQSSLVYGNAVHEALKHWALSVQEGKPLDEAGFLSSFQTYLKDRELLTDLEHARLLSLGKESLPRYYQDVLSKENPYIYKVEFAVQTILDSVPIKGKIDRIDLRAPESSIATIIDYKTGAPKTEKQIIDDADYLRQLQFYALLLRQKNSILEPEAYVLDFVGEREKHPVKRVFTVSENDIKELSKLVKDVWAKILALDFTPM